MPLYEYECNVCKQSFEKLVFYDGEDVRCPVCTGKVHRLLSPFHVDVPDEVCSKLPKGESRELCTDCRQGGSSCPLAA